MRGSASSEDPADEVDAHEAVIRLLRGHGASNDEVGEIAMECLGYLLDIEHFSLASWHACRYESFWDDGRKLEILERMQAAGMESHPIMLCHRWKLSQLCIDTKPELYQKLLPKLPPRTDKKEKP